ncbi:hypothetical protein D9758_016395 [Tetrapyrgos nigripes]|uniref:Uncharacterized protein n=1 Tax=Tetrapyrgos nigripes TaxID=182062 RepID=A0A8H5C8Q4_9AGAR|nr:hypothetical protein D9758_016395 [Tetrapyrgos nigripes]
MLCALVTKSAAVDQLNTTPSTYPPQTCAWTMLQDSSSPISWTSLFVAAHVSVLMQMTSAGDVSSLDTRTQVFPSILPVPRGLGRLGRLDCSAAGIALLCVCVRRDPRATYPISATPNQEIAGSTPAVVMVMVNYTMTRLIQEQKQILTQSGGIKVKAE